MMSLLLPYLDHINQSTCAKLCFRFPRMRWHFKINLSAISQIIWVWISSCSRIDLHKVWCNTTKLQWSHYHNNHYSKNHNNTAATSHITSFDLNKNVHLDNSEITIPKLQACSNSAVMCNMFWDWLKKKSIFLTH